VVPNDENWIIQGALGPDGVPVQLDARISSGSAVDFSEASIIVRYVRFSGQSAPLDLHAAARDEHGMSTGYLSSPYFGGGETRLGGAFSYNGGGLHPEVRTPKLIFEHVVFDKNRAICHAAVSIIGRTNTMSSLDLVVDGCLFFHNVAAFVGSGLYATDLMPGALLVNNTEFYQNNGFASIPIGLIANFDAKVGVQGRRSTYTIANTHIDASGEWTFQGPGIICGTGWGPYNADGTIHDALYERVTVVDVMADGSPYAFTFASNGLTETHFAVRECRVARVVGVEGSQLSSAYHSAVAYFGGSWTMEISRLTLEDSGSFVDQSHGKGTLLIEVWKSISVPASTVYRVVDSTFVRNQAANGGAISVLCNEVKLDIQRCFFEVGAHQLRQ
jgi:hypothetical protein